MAKTIATQTGFCQGHADASADILNFCPMLPKLQRTTRLLPTQLFRSLWGLESQSRSWRDLFANIRSQGFDGVEASLADIGWYQDRGRSFLTHLRDSQLSYVLGLYSDWDDYEGSPATRHTYAQHAAQLQDQLGCALALESPAPVHINIHGGSDRLSVATAAALFRDTAAFITTLGIPSSRVSFARRIVDGVSTLPGLQPCICSNAPTST